MKIFSNILYCRSGLLCCGQHQRRPHCLTKKVPLNSTSRKWNVQQEIQEERGRTTTSSIRINSNVFPKYHPEFRMEDALTCLCVETGDHHAVSVRFTTCGLLKIIWTWLSDSHILDDIVSHVTVSKFGKVIEQQESVKNGLNEVIRMSKHWF